MPKINKIRSAKELMAIAEFSINNFHLNSIPAQDWAEDGEASDGSARWHDGLSNLQKLTLEMSANRSNTVVFEPLTANAKIDNDVCYYIDRIQSRRMHPAVPEMPITTKWAMENLSEFKWRVERDSIRADYQHGQELKSAFQAFGFDSKAINEVLSGAKAKNSTLRSLSKYLVDLNFKADPDLDPEDVMNMTDLTGYDEESDSESDSSWRTSSEDFRYRKLELELHKPSQAFCTARKILRMAVKGYQNGKLGVPVKTPAKYLNKAGQTELGDFFYDQVRNCNQSEKEQLRRLWAELEPQQDKVPDKVIIKEGPNEPWIEREPIRAHIQWLPVPIEVQSPIAFEPAIPIRNIPKVPVRYWRTPQGNLTLAKQDSEPVIIMKNVSPRNHSSFRGVKVSTLKRKSQTRPVTKCERFGSEWAMSGFESKADDSQLSSIFGGVSSNHEYTPQVILLNGPR